MYKWKNKSIKYVYNSFYIFYTFAMILINFYDKGQNMKKARVIKIGKNIQAIRKSHGYTQEKLAEAIECSPRYIGDIEQDRSKPSYEVLVKLCNLFNIGTDDIFSEYLEIKGKREINNALFGFDKLKPNNKDTIIHMIEYFNKGNVS